MLRQIIIAIKATLIFWVITAIIYPLFILGIGQIMLPDQANGSLIKNEQGTIVGSTLIGQNFTSEKYFHSRPSAINYSEGEEYAKTGISGASNLAPSNEKLITQIKENINQLTTNKIKPTSDLIYTSASGLDPHISIESAKNQIERIAKIRNLDTNKIELLIVKNTDHKFLEIFGESGVNVLKLNLDLDNIN